MIREAENDEVTGMNAMLSELKQSKVKVIRVTKKLLNNTVFVIFEDESPLFPMYRIINECRNVKINLQQYNMDEPKNSSEVIEYN